MKVFKHRDLSKVHMEITKEDLEQDITDLEIENMEQEQALTDHDIAIMELQERLGE